MRSECQHLRRPPKCNLKRRPSFGGPKLKRAVWLFGWIFRRNTKNGSTQSVHDLFISILSYLIRKYERKPSMKGDICLQSRNWRISKEMTQNFQELHFGWKFFFVDGQRAGESNLDGVSGSKSPWLLNWSVRSLSGSHHWCSSTLQTRRYPKWFPQKLMPSCCHSPAPGYRDLSELRLEVPLNLDRYLQPRGDGSAAQLGWWDALKSRYPNCQFHWPWLLGPRPSFTKRCRTTTGSKRIIVKHLEVLSSIGLGLLQSRRSGALRQAPVRRCFNQDPHSEIQRFTPWKINMEPTNHPCRKENQLTNLRDYVPF